MSPSRGPVVDTAVTQKFQVPYLNKEVRRPPGPRTSFAFSKNSWIRSAFKVLVQFGVDEISLPWDQTAEQWRAKSGAAKAGLTPF